MFTATVETGIRKKKREFSWANIEQTCKKRHAYTLMYKKKLLGETVDQTILESYEKDLSLVTIVMARSQAEMDTQKILESRKVANANRGWFSGWWSSSAGTADEGKEGSETLKTIKKEFTIQVCELSWFN